MRRRLPESFVFSANLQDLEQLNLHKEATKHPRRPSSIKLAAPHAANRAKLEQLKEPLQATQSRDAKRPPVSGVTLMSHPTLDPNPNPRMDSGLTPEPLNP